MRAKKVHCLLPLVLCLLLSVPSGQSSSVDIRETQEASKGDVVNAHPNNYDESAPSAPLASHDNTIENYIYNENNDENDDDDDNNIKKHDENVVSREALNDRTEEKDFSQQSSPDDDNDILIEQSESVVSNNEESAIVLGDEEPNWSVFDIISDDHLPPITASRNVVLSIPVQHFWDFHKGQFKFGILGDSVADLYPEYVTNSRRKFSVDSPVYNVTSANTDIIFTHLVLVIQHMASLISETISPVARSLVAESDNIALKIIRIANDTGIEWRTANEIRTSREVLEIKKNITDAEILREINREKYRNDTFHFYNARKLELLQAQHQNILDAIFASHARQDEMEAKKHEDLLVLAEVTEQKRRETQMSILEHDHQADIDRLKVEVELGIKAIKFRSAEEGKVDRENEDVSFNIMKAKGESMRKGFEEIVTMLHLKAQMLLKDAVEHPIVVLQVALLIAAALSSYIVMLESAQAVKAYFASRLSTPAVLKQAITQSQSPGDPAHASQAEKLILSAESSHRVNSVLHVLSTVRASRNSWGPANRRLVLPNVLLVGPPGTGKTMSAKIIAERSGFPHVIVCGGDLLATGGDSSSAPGRHLRDVLMGASQLNAGKGFLVILDEVETIITDRGSRKKALEEKFASEEGSVSLESRECIHILLHMLRENSQSLGVIITTSLKLPFIDPSLLDRMDRVVSLTLPGLQQRLEHIISYSKELLSPYMEEKCKAWMSSLSAHGAFDLSSCDGAEFAAVMGKALGEDFGAPQLRDDEASAADASAKRTRRQQRVSESASASDDPRGSAPSCSERFQLVACLHCLLVGSQGWSHREIAKVIQNIQSDVIATEECVLTTQIWMRQLKAKESSIEHPGPAS